MSRPVKAGPTRRKPQGEQTQVNMRFPEWLRDSLFEYAAEQGITANAYVEKILLAMFQDGGLELVSAADEAVTLAIIEAAQVAAKRLTERRNAVDNALREVKAIELPKRAAGAR